LNTFDERANSQQFMDKKDTHASDIQVIESKRSEDDYVPNETAQDVLSSHEN